MRNGWDIIDSNLEKQERKLNLTGNEPLHLLFLMSISVGSIYVGICSKLQINWLRNGWDKVDSNLEKTGNENVINRKWIITFPVFEGITL